MAAGGGVRKSGKELLPVEKYKTESRVETKGEKPRANFVTVPELYGRGLGVLISKFLLGILFNKFYFKMSVLSSFFFVKSF